MEGYTLDNPNAPTLMFPSNQPSPSSTQASQLTPHQPQPQVQEPLQTAPTVDLASQLSQLNQILKALAPHTASGNNEPAGHQNVAPNPGPASSSTPEQTDYRQLNQRPNDIPHDAPFRMPSSPTQNETDAQSPEPFEFEDEYFPYEEHPHNLSYNEETPLQNSSTQEEKDFPLDYEEPAFTTPQYPIEETPEPTSPSEAFWYRLPPGARFEGEPPSIHFLEHRIPPTQFQVTEINNRKVFRAVSYSTAMYELLRVA